MIIYPITSLREINISVITLFNNGEETLDILIIYDEGTQIKSVATADTDPHYLLAS